MVRRALARYLLEQAGLKADETDSGAVTLIQRFGSAANLNIHLYCLVLDGVYGHGTDGEFAFVAVPAPTDEALLAVSHKIITRVRKLLTRRGVVVEEQGEVPLHRAPGAGQRAGAAQRGRAGGAESDDTVAPWHHALADVDVGVLQLLAALVLRPRLGARC